MGMHVTASGYHAARLRRIAASSGAAMSLVREDYDTPAGRAASALEWVQGVQADILAGRAVPLRVLHAVEAHSPGAVMSAWHDRPDYPMPNGFRAR